MFGFIASPCARCTRDSLPVWRGAFCGLARCLGREYGDASRLLVNRDAAFIGLVGMSLDPIALPWKNATCCNPLANRFPVSDDHPAILHAAAVSVCGLAAKLADDSHDEGFLRRGLARIGRVLTGPAVDRAVAALNSSSFPTEQVWDALAGQEEIEVSDPLRADQPVAMAYGTITSHLADLLHLPTQRRNLHRLGSALGSLVYWRDAWQDRREDQARGRFNPFATQDAEAIKHRIASAWGDFGASIEDLPFVRYGNLIAQIESSTGYSRQGFLQLQAEEQVREKAERKRQKKERENSCWNSCDCSHCCDCCTCDGCDCCSCH